MEARWLAIALLPVLALGACSSTSSDTAPVPATVDAGSGSDGAVPVEEPDTGDAAPASTRSDACLALDQKMQKALDGARGKSTKNATLALRTHDCPMMVYLSGDVVNGAGAAGLWGIGSITKTFVASVVMQLVDEKKLGFDDKIDKWFASFPRSNEITVRQLLRHTSGIYNYLEDSDVLAQIEANPKKVWTPQELIAVGAGKPLYFDPGTSWHYSNTNYIMLGVIAETLGGQPIAKAIRTRLLEPLQLGSEIFLNGSEPVSGTIVPSYQAGADVTGTFDYSVAWAAGAIVATPRAAGEWISAFVAGKPFSAASLTAMRETVATDTAGVRYGLGMLELDAKLTDTAGTARGHDGSAFGFLSQAFVFEKDYTMVSIVDESDGDANAITLAALEVLRQP